MRASERLEEEAGAARFQVGRGWREAAASLHHLIDTIEEYWLDAAHQKTPAWVEHEVVNTVMLATTLAPGGYVEL